MNKILLIVLLFAGISQLQAQEQVQALGANKGYETSNVGQRSVGIGEGFCDDRIYLVAVIESTVLPSCTADDGSITIKTHSNDFDFDYYLNGNLIGEDEGDLYTFENLPAGAYTVRIEGSTGESCEFFTAITNATAPPIYEELFEFTPARCAQGRVKKSPAADVQGTKFYIHDRNNVLLDSLQLVFTQVFLDPGDYYLRSFYPADSCEAFLAFKIEREIHTELPFIDDFSNSFVYPADARWEDDFAYINQTFAVNPPSIGVATLDGLNEQGLPYVVSSDFQTGTTDHLTSRPFCFNGMIDPADSLYLSFYYQAKGLGDFPNPSGSGNGPDSLIVEFKDSEEGWHEVWATDAANPPTDQFDLVKIPVLDFPEFTSTQTFFDDGFQFRFRAVGAQNGLLDPWHLDFVNLDTGVEITDTALRDMNFVEPVRSMLKNYEAMPWKQFYEYRDDELVDSLYFLIQNTNSTAKQVTEADAEIFEICDSIVMQNFNSVETNITHFAAVVPAYGDYDVQRPTELDWSLLESKDRAILQLTQSLQAGDNQTNFSVNDTISRFQVFDNFYAYDDGSAERAWGVFGSGAEVALQFVLNEPDMLQGVQLYFTHVINDVSGNDFSIKAWADLDFEDLQGVYDSVIAVRPNQFPLYTGETAGFTTYIFEEPVAVADTFYVGYEQGLPQILNIGQDLNHDSSSKLWVNTNGLWIPTIYEGAVMIRPILSGGYVEPTGIETVEQEHLQLFPNPTSDVLHLNLEGLSTNDLQLVVRDLTGKTMLQSDSWTPSISVEAFPSGMYLIELLDSKGKQVEVQRFIRE